MNSSRLESKSKTRSDLNKITISSSKHFSINHHRRRRQCKVKKLRTLKAKTESSRSQPIGDGMFAIKPKPTQRCDSNSHRHLKRPNKLIKWLEYFFLFVTFCKTKKIIVECIHELSEAIELDVWQKLGYLNGQQRPRFNKQSQLKFQLITILFLAEIAILQSRTDPRIAILQKQFILPYFGSFLITFVFLALHA